MYTVEYYSTIKKKKIVPFATWVDLESIMLSEISQTESQIPYDVTYMWNLKINKQKSKTESAFRDQIGGCQRQEMGADKMGEGHQRI